MRTTRTTNDPRGSGTYTVEVVAPEEGLDEHEASAFAEHTAKRAFRDTRAARVVVRFVEDDGEQVAQLTFHRV